MKYMTNSANQPQADSNNQLKEDSMQIDKIISYTEEGKNSFANRMKMLLEGDENTESLLKQASPMAAACFCFLQSLSNYGVIYFDDELQETALQKIEKYCRDNGLNKKLEEEYENDLSKVPLEDFYKIAKFLNSTKVKYGEADIIRSIIDPVTSGKATSNFDLLKENTPALKMVVDEGILKSKDQRGDELSDEEIKELQKYNISDEDIEKEEKNNKNYKFESPYDKFENLFNKKRSTELRVSQDSTGSSSKDTDVKKAKDQAKPDTQSRKKGNKTDVDLKFLSDKEKAFYQTVYNLPLFNLAKEVFKLNEKKLSYDSKTPLTRTIEYIKNGEVETRKVTFTRRSQKEEMENKVYSFIIKQRKAPLQAKSKWYLESVRKLAKSEYFSMPTKDKRYAQYLDAIVIETIEENNGVSCPNEDFGILQKILRKMNTAGMLPASEYLDKDAIQNNITNVEEVLRETEQENKIFEPLAENISMALSQMQKADLCKGDRTWTADLVKRTIEKIDLDNIKIDDGQYEISLSKKEFLDAAKNEKKQLELFWHLLKIMFKTKWGPAKNKENKEENREYYVTFINENERQELESRCHSWEKLFAALREIIQKKEDQKRAKEQKTTAPLSEAIPMNPSTPANSNVSSESTDKHEEEGPDKARNRKTKLEREPNDQVPTSSTNQQASQVETVGLDNGENVSSAAPAGVVSTTVSEAGPAVEMPKDSEEPPTGNGEFPISGMPADFLAPANQNQTPANPNQTPANPNQAPASQNPAPANQNPAPANQNPAPANPASATTPQFQANQGNISSPNIAGTIPGAGAGSANMNFNASSSNASVEPSSSPGVTFNTNTPNVPGHTPGTGTSSSNNATFNAATTPARPSVPANRLMNIVGKGKKTLEQILAKLRRIHSVHEGRGLVVSYIRNILGKENYEKLVSTNFAASGKEDAKQGSADASTEELKKMKEENEKMKVEMENMREEMRKKPKKGENTQ